MASETPINDHNGPGDNYGLADEQTLPLIVIIGPTASGKSSLAINLAEALAADGQPAEIVNADSMAVYRGMDIGTAKPEKSDLERVRHHLIDILDVTQTATVAEFQQLARDVIDDLRARNIVPIMVGGSSLYVRAIVDDFEFPGTNPTVRGRWQAELDKIGAYELHKILAEKSPDGALAIEPGNGRRIVRALEVIELTGHFSPHLPKPQYLLANVHQFGLQLERRLMDERITERVHAMFAAGFIDEVKALENQGLRNGLTAPKALGYQQILSMLDGELSAEEAAQATIDGTKRLARKQLGWFRRDPRIIWLPVGGENLVEQVRAYSSIDAH